MSKKSQYRDDDGFIILKRIGSDISFDSKNEPGEIASPRKGLPVGDNYLYYPKGRVSPGEQNTRATTYRIYASDYQNNTGFKRLVTAYNRKAWQNKAWNNVGKTIDWKRSSGTFAKCECSRKVRHIKRVGIMCRVRAEMDIGGKSKVLDHLATDTDNSAFPYLIIDTPSELKQALEIIQRMMYVNIDRYIKMCNKEHLEVVTITLKAIVVYDDYTYDVVAGNPQKIFDLLNINVDEKGRVTL